MMGRMFLSELLKIRRSRSLKKACIFYIALILLCALSAEGEMNLGYSGIRGPFVASSYIVPWSYWVVAAFSSLTLGGEFDGKLLRNVFACGVSRGKFYAVKVLTTYLVSFFLYLTAVLLVTVIRTARFGFNPDGLVFEDYWLKVFAYNGLGLAVMFAYGSLFNLLCFVFRCSGIPFIVGVALTFVDFLSTSLSIKYYGYLREQLPKNLFSIVKMMHNEIKDLDILNPEFLGMLYIPCLCVIGVSLAAGYVLFKVRDPE